MLQKLAFSSRHVVKETSEMNGGADWRRDGPLILRTPDAGPQLEVRSHRIPLDPGDNMNEGNAVGACQCLPPKAQRFARLGGQVVKGGQFAGVGPAAEKGEILEGNSTTIVSDGELVDRVGREADLDRAGSGIDGVVNQLFDHVGRACELDRGSKQAGSRLWQRQDGHDFSAF